MIGPLIAAGASLLGGVLGNNAAKKQAEKQYQHQKEFAQSGIQWKVQDAEKAGIHPLYAMGAQTSSYAPTSVGGTDFGLPEAGQNIGRAIDATRNAPAQEAALRLTAAQIDGVNLDNELKKAQLASALALASQSKTALPSPFDQYAIPGQGNTPLSHTVKEPQFTSNLRMFGKDIAPSPNFSDAQTFEDRYGEMSDFIAGPAIAAGDWRRNSGPYYDRNVAGPLKRKSFWFWDR